jgi:ComF family protein
MRNLVGFLIGALYPGRCRSCGQPTNYDNVAEVGSRSTGFFCTECASDISPIKSPFCTVCGMPFPDGSGPDHPCSDCLSHETYYHSARSAAEYKGTLKAAVHLYKYRGIQAMHKFLGPLAADAAMEYFPDAHVAAAVPLHRRRLAKRGFNQSLFLAKHAAEGLSIPLSLDGLVRTRYTRPQVDLDPAEREENVKGAFAVEKPEEFRDKRVLLLDDVYTTGATVRECAKVLVDAGAEAVYVLTVARAV